jgi:hypothetical protein
MEDSLMARVFYRIGQFWRGLSAHMTPADRQQVAELLPPAALSLFMQMPVDAQRHSLSVLASVRAAGYHHPDLAIAALLHDCGKVAAARGGVKLGLWLRGPLVVVEALMPRLVARWASPNPEEGWRYALYVQRAHPAIGALWAAEAGCSALSCWLIAHHQRPVSEIGEIAVRGDEARTLLAALQEADNGN